MGKVQCQRKTERTSLRLFMQWSATLHCCWVDQLHCWTLKGRVHIETCLVGTQETALRKLAAATRSSESEGVWRMLAVDWQSFASPLQLSSG